jgi:diguanylate cyclase (GGDEF)-like protein
VEGARTAYRFGTVTNILQVKVAPVKLRLIVLSLALMSLIAVITGSFLYYGIIKKTVLAEANRRAASDADAISHMFTAYLSENAKSVKTLAGMDTIQAVFHDTNAATLAGANGMLDHFQRSLGTDVCYLMNTDGLTLASSNRNDSRSFVGKNFGFRPYFQQALGGEAAVYMALGATSNKRGIYYSHPVGPKTGQAPVGVVVIKAGIDPIEERASAASSRSGGFWALVNTDGVIFASNRDDWRFHFLGRPDEDLIDAIARSRQFGITPMRGLGFEKTGADEMQDCNGVAYLVHGRSIDSMAQWQVLYFYKAHDALAVLTDPIIHYRKPIIIAACVLFSVIIFTLSSMAFLDIRDRRRKRDALAIQNAYLSALHDTALGLIGRLEFNELISAVLSRAGALTGTRDGFLYLYHPDRDELELMVGLGIYEDEVGRCVKPGQGLSGKIYQSGETLVLDDYSAWPDRLAHRKYNDLHAVVGMPLKRRSSIAGVMGLGHFESGKTFGEGEIEIVERFCQLAVIALDNAQLYSRLQDELKERQRAQRALKEANLALERLAGLDGLTQIANRRRFDEVLQEEWKRLSRSKTAIALILLDVDFFKPFNDTYGHQSGDKCLQAIARTMSANAYRPADMAARYGGEEFAVLLPETDAVGARFVAQRIRAAIHNLKIPHETSEAAPYVTVSLGVACLTAGVDGDASCLIQLADHALYDAKKSGRNRVVLQDADYAYFSN